MLALVGTGGTEAAGPVGLAAGLTPLNITGLLFNASSKLIGFSSDSILAGTARFSSSPFLNNLKQSGQ
jgi:hypothetical protein